MALHINIDSDYLASLKEKDTKVHFMPCKIKSDGEANVSTYFENVIEKSEETEVLHNSFRGYPLQGKIYNIPEVYEGLILHESNKTLSEDTDRNLHLKGAFNKITYWNWDKVPSKNDAFDQALDWIDIAEALHAPIDTTLM